MEKIVIAGRTFVPVIQSTIEHDFWLMSQIRAAGLDHVTMRDGEPMDEFAMRLLVEVIDSGKAFDLLGGLFLPDGMEVGQWTPATAAETSNFLKGVSDPEDKLKIQSEVVKLLSRFFLQGLTSLKVSPKFSPPILQDGAQGSGSVDPSITATGT